MSASQPKPQPEAPKEVADVQEGVQKLNLQTKKAAKKPNKKKGKKGGDDSAEQLRDQLDELEHVRYRAECFDALFAEQEKKRLELAAKEEPVSITLPDGNVKSGIKHQTTPLDIAKGISDGFARSVVVADVDGVKWDMTRPFEGDVKLLQLLKFDDKEGEHVFWHSSAHILGQCMERLYGGKLTMGPALDDGFYYDVDIGDDIVSEKHYKQIEKLQQKIAKAKQPFQRLVLKKEDALDMFKFNAFKQEIIGDKVPDGENCTVYKCGPLIDLCRGPHVPTTGNVKAFMVAKNSSAYFKGSADRASLQRVYGISFPDKSKLKEHKRVLEEAKKRNHRTIGLAQELFFFHDLSPGSCFWLPHGQRIYDKLVSFIKSEYRARDYTEVQTPNIFSLELWKTSGHAQKYADAMFQFQCEHQTFAMKPMNCPGHCVMFGHRLRSYRELPMRLAEFGVLHRNELSGALSGLTRVRRFVQDDAHIFCTNDQIEQEVKNTLNFMSKVYGIFGFTFELELSTRPEMFLGEIAVWDKAEASLENVLNEFAPGKWALNAGDGAFYGPKIDITVKDCLNRSFQCATVQLDFQLPERFELEYIDKDGSAHRPVIVHRAILGSLERFIAILTEHTAGKWPFWMSPRQVKIVPVAKDQLEYAQSVRAKLHDAGYFVDVDASNNTLKKKIRTAQVDQYNFILVVGKEEIENDSVNIRTRDNQRHGTKSVTELLDWFNQLEKDHL